MTPITLAYESTVDDGVDLQMKVLERSRVFGRAWAQIAILAPMAGLATALALFSLPPAARAIGAVATALIVGATYLPLQRRVLRKRLREAALEARGGDVPMSVQVEIDDQGIHSSSGEHRMTIAWDDVSDVEHDDTAIEIYAHDGGVSSLPRHAFASPDDANALLERLDATAR